MVPTLNKYKAATIQAAINTPANKSEKIGTKIELKLWLKKAAEALRMATESLMF